MRSPCFLVAVPIALALSAPAAHAGDALARLLDRAVVRVAVERGDERLADLLLEGTRPRVQRLVNFTDPAIGATGVAVLLVDRSRRRGVGPTCDDDDLVIDVRRPSSSVAVVTISAPDSASLRDGVEELKGLRTLPYGRVHRPALVRANGLMPRSYSRPATPDDVPSSRRRADLTGVQRVAVSGLGRDASARKLAESLASELAPELRSLGAFDVLERDGLSNLLAEVALSQAGLTQSEPRGRVQKLAAADAILIVDVTSCTGRTDAVNRNERVTQKLGNAPRRPVAPTRLRVPVPVSDPSARAALEAVLGDRVGYRSEEDYQDDLDRYQRRDVPRYREDLRAWERARRERTVQWRQESTLRGELTARGSVRLVSMTDGRILWEAPFSVSERGEQEGGVRTVTVTGEDSVPEERGAIDEPPPFLVGRATGRVVSQALAALRRGAELPDLEERNR